MKPDEKKIQRDAQRLVNEVLKEATAPAAGGAPRPGGSKVTLPMAKALLRQHAAELAAAVTKGHQEYTYYENPEVVTAQQILKPSSFKMTNSQPDEDDIEEWGYNGLGVVPVAFYDEAEPSFQICFVTAAQWAEYKKWCEESGSQTLCVYELDLGNGLLASITSDATGGSGM